MTGAYVAYGLPGIVRTSRGATPHLDRTENGPRGALRTCTP